MDDIRLRALLRLHRGESLESISADLDVTVDQLAEWERHTDRAALRPPGLPTVSTQLDVASD